MLKNTVPWIYAVDDLNAEEMKNNLQNKNTKKNCKKQIKQSLELKQ